MLLAVCRVPWRREDVAGSLQSAMEKRGCCWQSAECHGEDVAGSLQNAMERMLLAVCRMP